MTDIGDLLLTTFISKTELATLRKSHAAHKGWCGWYRGEIAILEARLKKAKSFAWESTNRERLIIAGWTPPPALESDSGH